MKTINKARIITLIQKIEKEKINSISREIKIVDALTLQGLKSVTRTLKEVDTQKTELELSYLDSPLSKSGLMEVWERYVSAINKYEKKKEKVYDIQQRYNVSGIVWRDTEFGNPPLNYPWVGEDLKLIELDLKIINSFKASLVEFWLNYSILNNLSVYRRNKIWEKVESSEEIYAALPFYDWAGTWESSYYFSPSRMRSQGYDNSRKFPEFPDDKKHHEAHLSLGSGVSVEHSSVSYCACNEIPDN